MPHHELVIIGTGSGNTLLTEHLEGVDVGIIEACSHPRPLEPDVFRDAAWFFAQPGPPMSTL